MSPSVCLSLFLSVSLQFLPLYRHGVDLLPPKKEVVFSLLLVSLFVCMFACQQYY